MESSTFSPTVGRAVDAPTLGEALRRTALNHPDIVAVRTVDDGVSLTWSELLARVEAVAGGLAKLGVSRGDTVAIMLGNRPEFHIVDLAAVTLGAVPFSIYLTYPPAEIEYLIRDAGSKVAVVEQAHLDALLEARRALPDLAHVIVVDGEASPEQTTALADLEASNPAFDLAQVQDAVGPDDLVTLIYTSGTTGPPKGVQLSHHNVMSAAETVEQVVTFDPGSRVISWLPAAHIAERMAHHYIPIIYAGTVTCCPNPREVLSYLPQVHPTWFFAVPRIWEKLKAGLETMQAAQPEEQRRPIQQALAASLERVRLRQRGEPVPPELEARVAEADEQMFSKLRAMLGLDQVLAVNVGAAPTPVEVLEFFHALGIELAELWGMSETSGAGACNRPGEVKIGTVGPASPGVELKIAPDGELLVRGECVMLGYRNAPDKTAEALDPDGWLHTGDIGAIDEDGLPEDRRPQEGDHHQRRRQEHVAGQHRGEDQDGQPADRTGHLHRRPPALQHGADRARRRLRPAVGGAAGHRGRHARGAGARRPRSTPRSTPRSRRPTSTSPGSSRSRSSRSSRATGSPAARS